MIVCCCKRVSDRTIDQLARAGHDSVEAIGRACGAGTDCGACRCEIEERLEDARDARVVPAGQLTSTRAA